MQKVYPPYRVTVNKLLSNVLQISKDQVRDQILCNEIISFKLLVSCLFLNEIKKLKGRG